MRRLSGGGVMGALGGGSGSCLGIYWVWTLCNARAVLSQVKQSEAIAYPKIKILEESVTIGPFCTSKPSRPLSQQDEANPALSQSTRNGTLYMQETVDPSRYARPTANC